MLTPTRNPQGFGPFSPSAGTERPLQRGRTALVQGADGDQAEDTPQGHCSLGEDLLWDTATEQLCSSWQTQDRSRKDWELLVSELAMHQGSETQVPTIPGTLPITKPQIQHQTLLGKPSKQQVGPHLPILRREDQTPAGAAASLEHPAKGSGAAWPPLPLLILSPFASMCRELRGSQCGSSHHARSGREAPLHQQLLG